MKHKYFLILSVAYILIAGCSPKYSYTTKELSKDHALSLINENVSPVYQFQFQDVPIHGNLQIYSFQQSFHVLIQLQHNNGFRNVQITDLYMKASPEIRSKQVYYLGTFQSWQMFDPPPTDLYVPLKYVTPLHISDRISDEKHAFSVYFDSDRSLLNEWTGLLTEEPDSLIEFLQEVTFVLEIDVNGKQHQLTTKLRTK